MVHFRSSVYFLLMMVSSFNLWASGDEHHINWWGLGSKYEDSPALGWQIFTFLVFIFLLVSLAKKPLGAYLELRSKEIEKLIKDAESAVALAKAEDVKARERLSSLQSEVAKIKEDFIAAGKEQKEEIIKDADDLARRIKEDAKTHIAAEALQAEKELEAKAISLAVAISKQHLEKSFSVDKDRGLQEKFINEFPVV